MSTSNVIQSLTAAEISIAERTAKLSIATIEDANFPKADLLGALAWVYAKRSEPTLKFTDYMGSRTLEQISDELGIEDDEDEDEDESAE